MNFSSLEAAHIPDKYAHQHVNQQLHRTLHPRPTQSIQSNNQQ